MRSENPDVGAGATSCLDQYGRERIIVKLPHGTFIRGTFVKEEPVQRELDVEDAERLAYHILTEVRLVRAAARRKRGK